MQTESKQQILGRQKEIEQELVEMLKETDPPSLKLRTGREQFTLGSVQGNILRLGSTKLTTSRSGQAFKLIISFIIPQFYGIIPL